MYTKCTCPSGDGSLRYPCPDHTEDKEVEKHRKELSVIIKLQREIFDKIGIFFYPDEIRKMKF